MKIYKIGTFKRIIIIVAGILAIYAGPVFAQGQTGQQSSPSSTQNQSVVEKNNTQMSNSVSVNKAMPGDITDDEFVKKASHSNLAEIELSNMALQKASSEKVKEYARMMIDHHTTAQIELSSMVSKSNAMQGSQSTAGSISNDANDETNIESENNDADKTATLGGTGGTTGSSMAMGKTNGQYNSNIDNGNTNNNTASGSNNQNASGNVTSETSGSANTNSGNTSSDSGNVSSNTASTTSTNPNPSIKNGYLPTELSAEHQTLKNKLSILSGAEFDSQYMQAMVEDHAKAVELFEKQALHSKDTHLQGYASKNLPIIKEHYQKAQQLGNNSGKGAPASDNKGKNSK